MIAKLIKYLIPISTVTISLHFFSSTHCTGDGCCDVHFSDLTSFYFVGQKLL